MTCRGAGEACKQVARNEPRCRAQQVNSSDNLTTPAGQVPSLVLASSTPLAQSACEDGQRLKARHQVQCKRLRARPWAWLAKESLGAPLRTCASAWQLGSRAARRRRGGRWRLSSDFRQRARECAAASVTRRAPRVRVAHGEGIGRSRSGPASILLRRSCAALA